jgi:hypothetical protein
MPERGAQTSTRSANLADVLELVLDRGIVIADDIKIKLAEIELLTIQLRLVVCSVDQAKEIGLDWWNERVSIPADGREELTSHTKALEQWLAHLESELVHQHSRPNESR